MVLNCKYSKLNLWVFLSDYIAALVTYCAIKMTATCSPMIGYLYNMNIVLIT